MVLWLYLLPWLLVPSLSLLEANVFWVGVIRLIVRETNNKSDFWGGNANSRCIISVYYTTNLWIRSGPCSSFPLRLLYDVINGTVTAVLAEKSIKVVDAPNTCEIVINCAQYLMSNRDYSNIKQNNQTQYRKNKIHYRLHQCKRLASCEFLKNSKQILNRGKTSVPVIINGPEVISRSSDKSYLLYMIFAFNSELDYKDYPFHQAQTCNIYIKGQKVSRLIKSLKLKMSTGPDKISMVVLKNISPFLQRQQCKPLAILSLYA